MRKEIVQLHRNAGWTRHRKVTLPLELDAYLQKIDASPAAIGCSKNLFGLTLKKSTWNASKDRLLFDFGVFDHPSQKVVISAMNSVVRDMTELKTLWGLNFDKPVPLLNNFRDSEGISENIFFDSSGSFFAMGDDIYKIGCNYSEAMDYLLAEPLPNLPVFAQ